MLALGSQLRVFHNVFYTDVVFDSDSLISMIREYTGGHESDGND